MKKLSINQIIKGIIMLFMAYLIVCFVFYVPIRNLTAHIFTTIILAVMLGLVASIKIK